MSLSVQDEEPRPALSRQDVEPGGRRTYGDR